MTGPSASIVPAASAKATPLAKSGSQSGNAPPVFGVVLGPVGFVLARLGIFLLHAVCAAYFVAAGLVYYVLPSTHLDALIGYYELTVKTHWYRSISSVHFLFAAVHGLIVLWAVVAAALFWCLRRRFERQTSSIKHRTASLLASLKGRYGAANTEHKLSSISSLVVAVKPTRVGKVMIFLYQRVAAQKGIFDVESHDFELSFLLREVAETVLQAYQAYQMSRLLPRPQLIRFYVTMLVINCWATPLLHHVSGQNEPLKRLLCLLCDVLLDFVSVVGVPVWLALDYMAAYDPTTKTFEFLLFYNETWMVRLLNDVPLILLGSWLDGFSRLVFALSMFSTIDDIKKLVKRQGETTTTQRAKLTKTHSASRDGNRRPTRQRKLLVLWTHRVMMGFGVVILAIQLHAEFKPEPPACALQIRPWLIAYPACALVEINCVTEPDRTGNRGDFEAIFSNLDAASLLQIVVRHCPQLEVSARVKTFSSLIGLKVYNATLATWGADAAITAAHLPNLQYMYFVRTQFPNATLPKGLALAGLNDKYKEFTISSSNLNRLPDTLDEHWAKQIAIHVEYAELTDFPMVLTKMNPSELSLSYNKIAFLPQEAFQLTGITAFTGNPIAALPEEVDASLILGGIFLIDRTLLTNPLPLWIDEAFVANSLLLIGGSPFCEQVALNATSDAYTELLETRPWLVDGTVDCSLLDIVFYPLGVDVRASEGLA